MEWTKVRTAADCIECPFCEEPFCQPCDLHYADCNCVGPTQDDEYDYKEIEGILWAARRIEE